MCTIRDTKLTTVIISALRRSIRKPISKWMLPMTPQSYRLMLVLPMPANSICHSRYADSAVDSATASTVRTCADQRGIKRMPQPTMTAAVSGASTMATRMRGMAVLMSVFQAVDVVHVDTAAVAEQHHHDGQADGGFRGRHREDEKHEYLPGDVVQVTGERDEVEVRRQQQEFHAHQQQDHVLAVEEYAREADGEQRAAQGQEVEQRNHGFFSGGRDSDGMCTMRTRPRLALTRTCFAMFWWRTPWRLRKVSMMAATMPTSRITPAISKGNP